MNELIGGVFDSSNFTGRRRKRLSADGLVAYFVSIRLGPRRAER